MPAMLGPAGEENGPKASLWLLECRPPSLGESEISGERGRKTKLTAGSLQPSRTKRPSDRVPRKVAEVLWFAPEGLHGELQLEEDRSKDPWVAALRHHHSQNVSLHPSWLFAHLVAEAVDGGVGAGEGALLDDGPEEPGEGGLLLVLPDLVHRGLGGDGGVGPDPGPVVDQHPGQLGGGVEVGDAVGEQGPALLVH